MTLKNDMWFFDELGFCAGCAAGFVAMRFGCTGDVIGAASL